MTLQLCSLTWKRYLVSMVIYSCSMMKIYVGSFPRFISFAWNMNLLTLKAEAKGHITFPCGSQISLLKKDRFNIEFMHCSPYHHFVQPLWKQGNLYHMTYLWLSCTLQLWQTFWLLVHQSIGFNQTHTKHLPLKLYLKYLFWYHTMVNCKIFGQFQSWKVKV